MPLENLTAHFDSYLTESRELSDITPFLLVYIRLLLLFENELSHAALNIVLQRQKQLRGEEFKDDGFDEMRNSSGKEMARDPGKSPGATRKAMLNRLQFCALLDKAENDFFYLTEPMYEFVREMKVSPEQLKQILESEFVGFKVRQ